MSQIGIFSGSFNPIHNGHISLARHILTSCKLYEVWLVVSPNNPLKNSRTLLDEKLRYQMVTEAVAEYEGLQSCDIELHLPRPSYTANTLRELSRLYPEHSFALIIGSDNMSLFSQWREWQYIADNYRIIVYPRKGDDMQTLRHRYPNMDIVDNAPLFPISSTMIRQLYKNGNDYEQLVPKNVARTLSQTKNLWE